MAIITTSSAGIDPFRPSTSQTTPPAHQRSSFADRFGGDEALPVYATTKSIRLARHTSAGSARLTSTTSPFTTLHSHHQHSAAATVTLPPAEETTRMLPNVSFSAIAASTSFDANRTLNATVNNASLSSTAALDDSKCEYIRPAYLEERFWLVSVVGTSVALISVFENLFLFFLFARKRHNRNSHCLYLILLAFFDVFMGAAYVPLMSFSLLLDYLESVWLLRAWYTYMTPLITTSHIAMTSSSFLILAASFERYCITCWPSRIRHVNRHRRHIAAGAVFLGIITKFTLAAEFEIIFNTECVGTMLEYSLRLSPMALDHYYNLFWRLGFRNVVTVLLPFFLLLVMNLRIVAVLRNSATATVAQTATAIGRQQQQLLLPQPQMASALLLIDQHDQQQFQQSTAAKISAVQRKVRVRAATRTLLMLVFTYLLSNVLNVVLTFWEYIDIRSLTENFIAFYMFSVDTVSIFTIFAGALRLPIYVSCMPQLRKEIVNCIKLTYDDKHHKPPLLISDNLSTRTPLFGSSNFFGADISSATTPTIPYNNKFYQHNDSFDFVDNGNSNNNNNNNNGYGNNISIFASTLLHASALLVRLPKIGAVVDDGYGSTSSSAGSAPKAAASATSITTINGFLPTANLSVPRLGASRRKPSATDSEDSTSCFSSSAISLENGGVSSSGGGDASALLTAASHANRTYHHHHQQQQQPQMVVPPPRMNGVIIEASEEVFL